MALTVNSFWPRTACLSVVGKKNHLQAVAPSIIIRHSHLPCPTLHPHLWLAFYFFSCSIVRETIHQPGTSRRPCFRSESFEEHQVSTITT